MTTLQSLAHSLLARGSRKALGLRAEYGTRWWTYEQLHRNVCRAAWALDRRGLQPGSNILIWCDNCPEFVAYLLGAALRGIQVAVVDAGMPPQRVAEIAARLKTGVLICGKGQDAGAIPVGRLRLHGFDGDCETGSMERLTVPIDPQDAAVVVFTSGTSQQPRGVVLTHANLMCQANRFWYWRYIGRVVPIRLLALSPLSHVQGLMLAGIVPLSLGLSVIHTRSIVPTHILRTLREGRAIALSTVPRVLELLEETLRREFSRPSAARRWTLFRAARRAMGWRFFVVLTGGATLPRPREEFWKDSGCILVQGYGSTETAAFVTVNRPFIGRFGSIGRAVHRDSVRIAEDGEILVRGPGLSPGYWDERIQPLDLTPEGFFRTGDLAARDNNDRLFFKGRKGDLIVTAEGHNVHPHGLENALRESPGVRDAVVFGARRNGMDEVYAVLLMTAAGSAAEAVHRTNETLPAWERIRSWSVWPEPDFPRGVLQKVARNEVIARVAAPPPQTPAGPGPGSFAEIAAEPDRALRLDRLAAYVSQTPGAQTPEAVRELIRGLGLDSIEFVQLLTRTETAWDVALDSPQSGQGLETFRDSGWDRGLLWNPIRRVLRGAILTPYMGLRIRLTTEGTAQLRSIEPPYLLALSGRQMRHSNDYMALYRALPARLAKRLFFGASLLGLEPVPDAPHAAGNRAARFASLFFPYVPLPPAGATMRGLLQICEWIDRGYNPVLTWNRGAALVALQTQAAVIPVRLGPSFLDRDGMRRADRRPRIHITFGEPFLPRVDLTPAQLLHAVFGRLDG